MKNKHGYDHRAAIQPNTPAAYKLGFDDGRHGADCYPEGSELYREGWRHGREWLPIDREDQGYSAGLMKGRALTYWPSYLTDDSHFVRGWHKGVAARQHQQPTR
jgi:hypothetical protein